MKPLSISNQNKKENPPETINRSEPWRLKGFDLAILLLALLLRWAAIEIKPPHFDEGINGAFVDSMFSQGFYAYDPQNFHGPIHFYALFATQYLFGRELWALRLPAILISGLCVWAILRYRDFIGERASQLAALCIAISPAYVFYGRYSIHENWQVLFSLIAVHAFLKIFPPTGPLIQTFKQPQGTKKDLYLLFLSVTGMILTKETYILHLGCLLLCYPTLRILSKVFPNTPLTYTPTPKNWNRDHCMIGAFFGIAAILFFYSGTFLNFPALQGLWETHYAWFQTGKSGAGHDKPLLYWIDLIGKYETPALLGLIAGLRFILPSNPNIRLITILGAGTLTAYSIIHYKTPWCIISIVWPFYLALGAVLQELATKLKTPKIWLIPIPALILSLIFALFLNFKNYTSSKEPYVYVQTEKEHMTALKPLLKANKQNPEIKKISGTIMLESQYPLVWLLGDFKRIGYYNTKNSTDNPDINPTIANHDFLIIQQYLEPLMTPLMTREYYRIPFKTRHASPPAVLFLSTEIFKDYIDPFTPKLSNGKIQTLTFTTNFGPIKLDLREDLAPKHLVQLKKNVEAGIYNQSQVIRYEPNFILQFGGEFERLTPLTPSQLQTLQPIPAEFTQTPHKRGALTMARYDDNLNSATSSFSIVLGDSPHLDSKYTVIGFLNPESETTLKTLEALGQKPNSTKPAQTIQILNASF